MQEWHPATSVVPQDSLMNCLENFFAAGVHRLITFNEHLKAVGVISLSDILA
jgi:CBS-domain-containing membrane protein